MVSKQRAREVKTTCRLTINTPYSPQQLALSVRPAKLGGHAGRRAASGGRRPRALVRRRGCERGQHGWRRCVARVHRAWQPDGDQAARGATHWERSVCVPFFSGECGLSSTICFFVCHILPRVCFAGHARTHKKCGHDAAASRVHQATLCGGVAAAGTGGGGGRRSAR